MYVIHKCESSYRNIREPNVSHDAFLQYFYFQQITLAMPLEIKNGIHLGARKSHFGYG